MKSELDNISQNPYIHDYKQEFEKISLEKQHLQNMIKQMTVEINQRDEALKNFEGRERDLRESVQILDSKVNEINQPKLQSYQPESAIKMFNERLKQLEKDREDVSDNEKEILKTPNSRSDPEQEGYIKKLKNTLRIYKGRSREFEKRSIELD